MKPPLISTFIILLLALVSPVAAQNGAHAFSQAAYRPGERLTYNISFSNFPSAAHAEFEVVQRGVFHGRDAIQLKAHVETVGVVNVALFSINNDYLTYVDPETGLPFRSQQTARDAIKAAEAENDFPQPAGSEAIPPKLRALGGTFDFLSAFYRARALPLNVGAEYDLVVRGEGGDHMVEIKVVGRQVVRTNVGSFDTIVTEVKASNSRFRNVKIYFSDDERHVPVLFTGRVSSGELRAELAGSEMVKPPASAATPAPVPVAPDPNPRPVAPSPATSGPSPDWPFAINEQLNYQIFVGTNTTALGTATFHVRGRSRYFERDGVFLTVTAQTTNAAARVFVAKDQIDSYVDPKGLLPYRTILNLVEGKRRLNQTLNMNQETGTATTESGTRIEMPAGTHDYLSFFYALRMFNLTLTKRNSIPVLVENKVKTIIVTATKREAIGLGSTVIPAIALSITTEDPEPDKYQLRLWVSDDRRRLPLRITAMTQLGPVRADLAILPTTPQ
ncbi:MAG TPA: DUF3108 domain-containing protein [Pyrinomonadaceae bacterium]|nr:DUF3108 domain-containing protein [Pyrinomonadaceae bacterium]